MKPDHWQFGEYTLRIMSAEEFDPPFKKFTKQIFDERLQVFHLRDILSEKENQDIATLESNLVNTYKLRIGIFHKNDFVGWHFGRQEGTSLYYMQNSAVLPEHRRKGLYAELVRSVIRIVTENGFQEIKSLHSMTNNAVIIPKLQQGFVITGVEVLDLIGALVQLRYYHKDVRRKVQDYRVGLVRPDEEIRKILKF